MEISFEQHLENFKVIDSKTAIEKIESKENLYYLLGDLHAHFVENSCQN